ncbi:unnamed protein product [Ixodes persulcatus]
MDEADTAVIWDSDMQASKDPPYCPEERDTHDSDEEIPASSEQPNPNRMHEAKFLVFDSNLRGLLDRCLVCGSPHCEVELSFVGTMVRAQLTCPESRVRVWRSQPVLCRKPMGNISVCSAILFTGSSPTKVLRLFSLMGIQCVQKSQYFKFQSCYLLPAVTEVWLFEQAALLDRLLSTKLCLAGDGRANTPGHCADFGTYTLLETTTGQVIHTELVKMGHHTPSSSTQAPSSNRMETEVME